MSGPSCIVDCPKKCGKRTLWRFIAAEIVMTRRDPAQAKLIPANAQNTYEVTKADLPLSCPMPGMHLWNSHPRVMLPIEAELRCKCPYCGAVYVLKD
jgi:uncharacterized Zn-finger protein